MAKVQGHVQNVSGSLRSPVNSDDDAVSHEERAGRGPTVVGVLGRAPGVSWGQDLGCGQHFCMWVSAQLQRGFSRFPVRGKAGQFYPRAPW